MRMRRLLCISTLLSCLFLLPASAQTPDKGLIGVGGDLGIFFPDEAFEKAFTFDGFGEYYLTPRASIRGMLSWAKPGFENMTEDHFRQVRLLFNGVYNWEMGTWHPFATGGAGFYFVRQLFDNAADPDSETRGGLNFGGGIEYFRSNKASIRGEARWDIVSHPPGLPDATGFSITVGYKVYF
jgi:outer membrane protein with beta-barrel domain